MAESDVERAKQTLRKVAADDLHGHCDDLDVLLADHDRLTRELREAQERIRHMQRDHSLLGEEHNGQQDRADKLEDEVADLRAKLDATQKMVETWHVRSEAHRVANEAAEARLAELQRKAEAALAAERERRERLLAKCDELSALDQRAGFRGEGGIAIRLVREALRAPEPQPSEG